MTRRKQIGAALLTAVLALGVVSQVHGQGIVRAISRISSLIVGDGSASAPSIAGSTAANGFFFITGNPAISNSSIAQLGVFNGQVQLKDTTTLSWSSGGINATSDTKIGRIAVGVPGSNLVGGGTQTGGFPVSIFASTASASNGTTVETDLITYSLPANTLNATNQKVRITAYGTAAANANVKNVRLYFGATAVSNLGTAINGVGWMVTALVTRTGTATQVAGSMGIGANGTAISSQATAPTETLTGAVTIKVTGQSGTASGDITATFLMVEWIP